MTKLRRNLTQIDDTPIPVSSGNLDIKEELEIKPTEKDRRILQDIVDEVHEGEHLSGGEELPFYQKGMEEPEAEEGPIAPKIELKKSQRSIGLEKLAAQAAAIIVVMISRRIFGMQNSMSMIEAQSATEPIARMVGRRVTKSIKMVLPLDKIDKADKADLEEMTTVILLYLFRLLMKTIQFLEIRIGNRAKVGIFRGGKRSNTPYPTERNDVDTHNMDDSGNSETNDRGPDQKDQDAYYSAITSIGGEGIG